MVEFFRSYAIVQLIVHVGIAAAWGVMWLVRWLKW